MIVELSPVAKQQFFDDNGNILAGGLLNTYIAGTSTPLVTYQDSIGTPASNPVVLDSGGRASIWLDASKTYKFVLTDSLGNTIWTVDNISLGTGSSNVLWCDTVIDLGALTANDKQPVICLGYYAVGDGGGGLFQYNAEDAEVADGGMIVSSRVSGMTGNWLRMDQGRINVKWYGAHGDSVTDCSAAFTAASSYAVANGNLGLYANEGNFYFSSLPTLNVPVHLYPGALITLASNLQFVGDIEIDPSDKTLHFNMNGSSTVKMKGSEICPEWFGAVGDGSFSNNTPGTDNTTYIQFAINSCQAGQCVVFDSAKKYWTNSLTGKAGICFRGSELNTKDTTTKYRSNIAYLGSANTIMISLSNSGTGGIRGMGISELTFDGVGISLTTILYLETYGSVIKNCTFRNAALGVSFGGSSGSINNSVINCVFDTLSYGASATGAGTLNGTVTGCFFTSCTTDVSVPAGNGWIIRNNTNGSVTVISAYGSVISGNELYCSTEAVSSRSVFYSDIILGASANNSSLIQSVGGWADNSSTHSVSTDVWNRTHLVRKSASTSGSNTSRIHRSVGLQTANLTPRVDTRAWIEHDVGDGSIHMGDTSTEALLLTPTSLTVNVPETNVMGAAITPGSGAIPITNNCHVLNISSTLIITGLATANFLAGALVTLIIPHSSGTVTITLKHKGSPGTGYAALYINPTGVAQDFVFASGDDRTVSFIYDGLYWRLIGTVS